MMDYRGLEALYAVQESQSFEAAAKKLHVTQSAISQRIKALETHYGQPVLVRTMPYHPTSLGKQLVGHFKRLCLLEEDLDRELGEASKIPHLSIAINRDSLETWFLDLIDEKEIFGSIVLEVITDDQELTLSQMKNGLAAACLSTSEKQIIGGKVHYLGDMEYVLVASPSFVKEHFSKGSLKNCLQNAPAIKFDQKDQLHERYLEKFFNLNGEGLTFHKIPSVRGFKKYVLLGYGYALIPKIDIIDELKKKQLIQLSDKVWKIPFYWHYWAVESKYYQKFNARLIDHVIKKLKSLK